MRSAVRQLTAISALLACGALLSACGSTRHLEKGAAAGAQGTTAAHGRAPGAPPGGGVRPPSRAQATAFARAVDLTAADLPGFKVSPEHQKQQTPADRRAKHELARCTGGVGGGGHGVVELSSKSFERQGAALDVHISSNVSIAPTPSAAANELAEIRSAHVRGCLSRYLDLLFNNGKLHGAFSRVSIAHGEPPAPGASGTFGWRIWSALAFRRIKVPFYLDILGFVYGPAQVTLMSSGLIRPFPAAAQQQLFSLLLRRAESHSI
jgi:hypothetical protein